MCKALGDEDMPFIDDAIRAIRAERDRYREALEEIADYTAEHGEWSDWALQARGPGKVAGHVHHIARRAIEPPPGGSDG